MGDLVGREAHCEINAPAEPLDFKMTHYPLLMRLGTEGGLREDDRLDATDD